MGVVNQKHQDKMKSILSYAWCRTAEQLCLNCEVSKVMFDDTDPEYILLVEFFYFNVDEKLVFRCKIARDAPFISVEVAFPHVMHSEIIALRLANSLNRKYNSTCSVSISSALTFTISSQISFLRYYDENDPEFDIPWAQHEVTMNILSNLFAASEILSKAISENKKTI